MKVREITHTLQVALLTHEESGTPDAKLANIVSHFLNSYSVIEQRNALHYLLATDTGEVMVCRMSETHPLTFSAIVRPWLCGWLIKYGFKQEAQDVPAVVHPRSFERARS